jgi:peptide/nickel transport system substrate-binding protein
LVVLILTGGMLAGTSLFARLHNSTTTSGPVRGGTWTDDMLSDPDSLIPNGSTGPIADSVDHALYLPLFYGDAQGVIHPGAAREIPTIQNGGVNADATTWTFRLRRGLVWSDGQPYDARDVDYSWRLWLSPSFGLSYLPIRSAVVSPDNLSITFHLKQSYVPFLNAWADGSQAPLPAHHFSAMAPDQILKSSDNLNPTVTSGPFKMSESIPGDHYTVVRNPRYYLANKGLPYLDRVVFRVASPDTLLKDLQSGSIDSTWLQNVPYQVYPHLSGYSVVTSPTSARFEFIRFNFHNTVLATHLEVRQAIAMAIDQQALIQKVRPGFATPLCTDHPSAQHPGYDPNAPCPQFNRAAANKLLDDNGWVKGPDGVRTRKGQRLEFDYSAPIGANQSWRTDTEMFIQESLKEIGIKLDIQNYSGSQFSSFLDTAKSSPPTGAVAGRFDILQSGEYLGYDPDDSYLLACDQLPPAGENIGSYCNRTLDTLYQQELATPDLGQRQQIFNQIHNIYLTDYPFVVLFSLSEAWVVHKGTNDYLPSPINGETGNIWEWWCNSGKC